MNTNPKAKRILCFGDSNTRGWIPLAMNEKIKRYTSDVRWTGVLQKKLGSAFEVIEEGLDARTTVTDDPRPELPGRNGLYYLRPCLDSHKPLDLVIIMLGTTETKEMMDLTPEEITSGMKELLSVIQTSGAGNPDGSPKILLMSPPVVKEEIEFASKLFKGASEKSKKLSDLYEQLAEEMKCYFLDTSIIIETSDLDGVHLDPEDHKKLGQTLSNIVKELLK